MLIRPRALSLLTTRRCTAACDHCCIGSSPRAHGAIPISRLHALIDEAKAIPSIERIGFSGGECFLLGADLDLLIAHASQLAFETRVVTNGYWAVRERAAEIRVAALRTAGLSQMMLSTGTFHQTFVPIERIVYAARAAAAAGIPCRIAIETCDQQAFDESILHERLAPEIFARTVFLGHDPWTPDAGGRGAAQLTHDRLISDGRAIVTGSCGNIMDTITVTPDQQLLACCGFPMEQLSELKIGSVADCTLADVLRAAPNDLVKLWLRVAGPHAMAEFVAGYIPGYTLGPCVSICQACAALQSDPRAIAVIAEHGSDVAQAVMTGFVEIHGGLEPLRAF